MLKGTGVPVTDYHLDTVEEEGNLKTYVFKQKYKGFWIHENHITVGLSDKGIAYLEVRYRKINGIINSKKIMPVYQVLIHHHDSIRNITITRIDLGFKNTRWKTAAGSWMTFLFGVLSIKTRERNKTSFLRHMTEQK